MTWGGGKQFGFKHSYSFIPCRQIPFYMLVLNHEYITEMQKSCNWFKLSFGLSKTSPSHSPDLGFCGKLYLTIYFLLLHYI